jgi:hypothetical protein
MWILSLALCFASAEHQAISSQSEIFPTTITYFNSTTDTLFLQIPKNFIIKSQLNHHE